MKLTLIILYFTAAVALGADSLEQRLATRELRLRSTLSAQTLPQALASLSTDYQAAYGEPLPIFIAVDLFEASKTAKEPARPIPEIPGLERPSDSNPNSTRPNGNSISARTSVGPFGKIPVTELLRYVTSLGGVTFTIREDLVLIHAAEAK